MKSNQGIAIIYFSRNAAIEGLHKSWFKKKASEKNTLLAKVLIDQSFGSIQNLDLPVFHYHEGNQRGITFGEKLANAYADVFALGYNAVISMGNDTPEIIHIDWQKIKNELADGRCVIGASHRGGAYLIGITASSFEKISFQNLPWKSGKLFQDLTAYCQKNGELPVLLNALPDINVYQDLIKWLQRAKSRTIQTQILQILQLGTSSLFENLGLRRPNLFINQQLPSRAPPIS